LSGSFHLGIAPPVDVPDFLMDKYEVTNPAFKKFVESGGYRKQEYWKENFVKDGRMVSWEQATAEHHGS
jgi:formylglycine-generating enzyme required for sulfatase activity